MVSEQHSNAIVFPQRVHIEDLHRRIEHYNECLLGVEVAR